MFKTQRKQIFYNIIPHQAISWLRYFGFIWVEGPGGGDFPLDLGVNIALNWGWKHVGNIAHIPPPISAPLQSPHEGGWGRRNERAA